jgi:hypothetical protein
MQAVPAAIALVLFCVGFLIAARCFKHPLAVLLDKLAFGAGLRAIAWDSASPVAPRC